MQIQIAAFFSRNFSPKNLFQKPTPLFLLLLRLPPTPNMTFLLHSGRSPSDYSRLALKRENLFLKKKTLKIFACKKRTFKFLEIFLLRFIVKFVDVAFSANGQKLQAF